LFGRVSVDRTHHYKPIGTCFGGVCEADGTVTIDTPDVSAAGSGRKEHRSTPSDGVADRGGEVGDNPSAPRA
jgi:hypothetical protein